MQLYHFYYNYIVIAWYYIHRNLMHAVLRRREEFFSAEQ